jgi:endonuclease III
MTREKHSNSRAGKGEKEAQKIYGILEREYFSARIALKYHKPHELLIATILSAQCTDDRVNMVTKELFKKYRTVSDFASAKRGQLEKDIRSTGFFRNKARHIMGSARMIERDFGLEVPDTMEGLLRLPGVARKTANIVLFHGFGKTEGIAVDTHVKRVTARLALTDKVDPVKIEKDLMRLFDRDKWGKLTNVLIAHGRKVCRARKPLCGQCPVMCLCSYAKVKRGRDECRV